MCDQKENEATWRLLTTSLDDYGVSWCEELSLRRDHEDAGKATITSYYLSFVKGVTKYSLNDTVYLESGNGLPYVGRIMSLYQTRARREKQMIVRWFCRPCELPEGLPDVDYSENCKEVFLMRGDGARSVVNPASTIQRCSVLCTAGEDGNANFPSVEEIAAADHIFDRAFCPGELQLQNLDDIIRQYGEHHVPGFAGKSPIGYTRSVQSDGLLPEFRNSLCKREESSSPHPKAVGKKIGIPTPHEDNQRHRFKADGTLYAKKKPRVEYSASSSKQDRDTPIRLRENKIKKRSTLESDIGAGERNLKRSKSSFPTHIPSGHLNKKLRQPYENGSSSSATFSSSRDLISPQSSAGDDPKWEQSLGRNDHQAIKYAPSNSRSVLSQGGDRRSTREGKDTSKSSYPIVGQLEPQKSFSSPAGAQESVGGNSSDVYNNGGYAGNRISDLAIRPFGESSAVGVERRGQRSRQDHFDKQIWNPQGGSKTLGSEKVLRKEVLPLAERRPFQESKRQSGGDGSSVMLPDAKKSGDFNEGATSPVMSAKHEEIDFATKKWHAELMTSAQKNNAMVGGIQQMELLVEQEAEHLPLSRFTPESMVLSTLPIEGEAEKSTELAIDISGSTMEHRLTELELRDTVALPSEGTPETVSEPKKTFFNFSWKESLRLALEQEKAILLQNLDPWFSSFEIKTLLHDLLQFPCDARMLPPRNFACYFTGRAIVLFKTQEMAVDALKKLRENWLIWSSDERPVMATWATEETGKSSPIRGFFSIDEETEKYGRLRLIGAKSSVVTSHSSQANTVEYDMGIRWRLLQERHKLAWSISSQVH